jgi:hypothetical protein
MTIKAVVFSQEKCTGIIFKIYINNEGKCRSNFYKYVKRSKGNREDIAVIKDSNGRLITDSIENALYMSIMLRYSALNTESHKYSVLTHVNHSQLIMISLEG